MSPSFSALAIRNYRWFATGSLLNQASFWMQRVAQDWLLLNITDGSAVVVGVATALQFLPYLLLTPFTGTLADRWPRRNVLLASGSVAAASAAGMAVAAYTGHSVVPVIFTLAFAIGVAGAIDSPARQAFISDLVGRRFLVNAVGLNAAFSTVARIGGPALAGVIIAASGAGSVFGFTTLCLLLSIGTLLAIRLADLSSDSSQGERTATLRDGVRHLRQRPAVLFVLILVAIVATFGLNFQLTTSIMAVNEYREGAAAFGLMGTCVAVGSVVGAILAARRTTPGLRLVVVAAVAFAISETVTGLAPTFGTFLVLLPLNGFLAITFVTTAQSYIQVSVDTAFRGRIMGLYSLMLFGGTPVGATVIGWSSEVLGPRTGLVGGGLLTGIGVVVTVLAMRKRLSRLPHPPAGDTMVPVTEHPRVAR